MKIEQIKEIARQKGVKTVKMKKADIVRAIQQMEGNTECFDTGKAAECGQDKCLWREDCD